MNTKLKGFLLGAVAAATYGMNPLFTLPLYRVGITTDSVLFYRYATSLILMGILMALRRQSLSLARHEIVPLAVAGLLLAASSLFLFLSYKRMDAGVASTILFVYPVMVAVIMAVFFREKVTSATAFSILLSLAGIALLYHGGDGKPLNAVGIIMVVLSALSYAIYMVGVKTSPVLRDLPGDKLTFYVLLFGLSVFWVRLDFGTALQPLPDWSAWGNVLALAILPTVVSLTCTALAIRYIGATPTAILGALEPATAVFFGVTVFHEPLTLRLCLGVALIILAVSLIVGVRKPREDPETKTAN